jgi:hypothetical protein
VNQLKIPETAEERRAAATVTEGTLLDQLVPTVRCLVDAYLTHPNAASLKTARAALTAYWRGYRTNMGKVSAKTGNLIISKH